MRKHIHFIIIPGNPCASHYYKEWIKELQLLSTTFSFSYIGYPHYEEDLNEQEYFERIILHYENELLTLNHKHVRIHLIGHSIGGFIAMKIIERKRVAVEKALLIFPFLGDLSGKTTLLLHLIKLLLKSNYLKRQLIQHKNKFKVLIPEITKLSKKELGCSLTLATQEYNYFSKYKAAITAGDAAQLKFIYTKNDRWCTEQTVRRTPPTLSPIEIQSVHDYIVFPQERAKVTHLIKELYRVQR